MKLLIAIPALNEEDSIERIIERSLTAAAHIEANSPVTQVEVTVVSDGSTDRTVELASRYIPRIKLIVFEKNRGYGAAIKEAWSKSDAELLGFIDADGTCDPKFFAPLCQALLERGAMVALGSRMHPGSEMPPLRRVGNRVFAALLTVFSSRRVRDSASGMRVVRRDCLDRLFPLPDGLHFTPAMSARCLLSTDISICEVDMPYHERAGRSKLSVVKDGLRFLRVIVTTALLYRPSRLLGILGLAFFLAAAILMIRPILYYLNTRTVAEWMIYRFVVSNLLGTASALLLCMGHLSSRMVLLSLIGPRPKRLYRNSLAVLIESRAFWLIPAVLVLAGGALVYPSFRQLVTTGATFEHWSRFIVMSFLVGLAIILVVTRGVSFVLQLLEDRLIYLAGIAVPPWSPSGAHGRGLAYLATNVAPAEKPAAVHGPIKG
ncbi:MAG: glycosyltransferase family 2 protein [Bryobacteraceae bacterium]|jgi:glycosyltransferase involved in cell wall biosynthesis